MNKKQALKIVREIRETVLNLDKTKLYKSNSKAIEEILKILSYAENFDSEYGQKLRNNWDEYKSYGLQREDYFKEFKEKIIQLGIDIETYFKKNTEIQEPSQKKYIKQTIYDSISKGGRGFDYSKLNSLLLELESNYKEKNTYSCLMLIRATIDHIPPLLGLKTFDQLVSNYPLSQTDKAYGKTLLATKQILHDALHRPISKSEDLFDFNDVPEKMYLNRMLQVCLEGNFLANQLSKVSLTQKKKRVERVAKTNPPPIVEGSLQGISNGPDKYIVELLITNKGQELAVLKSLEITDAHKVDLGTFSTLSTNQKQSLKVNLYGTEFRNNSKEAKLSILYKDIYGNDYKSTYNIKKNKRDDGLYNLRSLDNFSFFQI